jgi:nicotinate-nucleotide adenylyltransferase
VRLAIFGGSFDPPHVGHLLAAGDACDRLALDRVTFVPAATQPLKAGRAAATSAQRLAMVRLLVAKDPRFEVSAFEVEQGGLSYTVNTLAHFASLHPADERFLLLGADVLESFGQWKEPERILQLARLVLLVRQTDERSPASSGADRGGKWDNVLRVPTRRIDVSSTEIRERVRLGKPIRGFVTDDVAELIARDGLYR